MLGDILFLQQRVRPHLGWATAPEVLGHDVLACLIILCLDPGSGQKFPAIWHDAGANPGFYPRNLVLRMLVPSFETTFMFMLVSNCAVIHDYIFITQCP